MDFSVPGFTYCYYLEFGSPVFLVRRPENYCSLKIIVKKNFIDTLFELASSNRSPTQVMDYDYN